MRNLADKLASWLLVGLALVFIAMTCLSVYNVVARYIFNRALLWADEIAVFGMIIITFLAAIACAWRGAEIRMDIFLNALPRRIGYVVRLMHMGLTAILCFWVAWLSYGYVVRVYNFGMTSDGARIPVWIVHAALPLGFTMIGIVAVVRLVQALLSGRDVESDNPVQDSI